MIFITIFSSETTVPPGFMDTILISVAMCILLLFTLRFFGRRTSKAPQKLPPGPYPLPIIGNIHKLGKHPHKSLNALAQVYGPIMRLKLGRVTTIVISSSSAAQEVLQKQDLAFSNRPVPDALRGCDHDKYSVVFLSVGSQWRSLRKITSSSILTANKLDASKHIRSRKVHELIGYCKKCSQSREAVDIGRATFLTSLNLLSNTIFSKDMIDLYQDSEEGKNFRELVWNLLVEAAKPNLVDYFPILKWIDPQGIKRRFTGSCEKLLELFDGLINERLELKRSGNFSENSTTDMLDELLTILPINEIDRTQIQHLFLDLFVAGTDTTSGTVEWAMAEILKNPDTILVKAKAELNEVVGKGEIVKEADISRLPYLQCIVKETGRLHPPAPFLIPRQVQEEVQLCGYTIPKNSQVLVNAWTIGRDPLIWKNPLSFQPERFLNSEVDVNGHNYELIPFGAGRRKCPGLPLAVRMVPVLLGSLINCFDWKLEGGIAPKELDMEDKFGITVAKLHPLRAVPTLVLPN
ncbi:geraniol 8-hydroxylase-like [Daucus carota subsp. sativus]